MARKPRVLYPDAIYHVTTRGFKKQRIILDAEDHHAFCLALEDVVAQSQLECLAFCQMHNHVHLLVRTPEANLPDAMRRLKSVYAAHFNTRYERQGQVFQGRYHARLVSRESQLLATIRYIFRNPVNTDPPLCRRPQDWLYGSYRATLGLEPQPAWLRDEWMLKLFHRDVERARQRLSGFVDGGLIASTGSGVRGQGKP